MTSYLLLRDNKEKGPYSLEQLIQIGFKPYDLVWIQGKSAAWRYPGEVEELKAHAPITEEQPFDRFFKKKTDTKREEIKNDEPVNSYEKIVPEEKKESFDPSTSSGLRRKTIYVTMPYQKKELSPNEYPEQPVKTIIIKENPAAAQVKYPEPVDEMKEVYAKSFQQRKQKIARRSLLLQRVKKASVFVYMIALGVLIGFTIKSYPGKKPISAAEKINQPQLAVKEPEQNISTAAMESEKKPEVVKPEIKDNLNLSTEINTQTVEKKIAIGDPEPFVQKKQTLSGNKKIDTTQISPGLEINSVTGERNRKNRTAIQEDSFGTTEEKTALKNDISGQVMVKGSDYKRGAFGGIRDLQLTVINNSKYILDDVIVELTYIKANELPLKKDNIQFRYITPMGSMTIAIPPTTRGVKVAYKILKIESKELNNETAGL